MKLERFSEPLLDFFTHPANPVCANTDAAGELVYIFKAADMLGTVGHHCRQFLDAHQASFGVNVFHEEPPSVINAEGVPRGLGN